MPAEVRDLKGRIVEDAARPHQAPSIDELKIALVAASVDRADQLIARLTADTREAAFLSRLDFLPVGERDRFRRIALFLAAELDGIAAARARAAR